MSATNTQTPALTFAEWLQVVNMVRRGSGAPMLRDTPKQRARYAAAIASA
jgi:hypothetical protein